ncbi:MAG TPA: DHH family phosphoesterase [Candidatus Saccharimonadales bacterium]|nr:DHH family phosphoesterase [Candidatus Saccharimonadales bacterium]
MKKTPQSLIESANSIVIIQADNPDGDSLASSLALEAVFIEMGKKPVMYCGVDIPSYLRFMKGWDRVVKSLPHEFDLSIIVDTGSILLLENLQKTGDIKWLKSKPCIIIDHHITEPTIDFATTSIIKEAVSTGELIYGLCKQNKWPLPLDAKEYIVNSILSDSLGLISESTTPTSVRIIADLIEGGVSLAELDSKRKVFQKKQPELLSYKGDLLKRVEYLLEGQVAYISIPWAEIEKYSPLYNPSMLVIDEMRQVEKVKVAVAFKHYPDGRITAKLRSNYGYPLCDAVAEQFGGGGHPYASGFRVTDGSEFKDILSKCANHIEDELNKLKATNDADI